MTCRDSNGGSTGAGTRTLTIQSSARPSLCSLVPPTLQGREMPIDALPYVAVSSRASLTAPGLGAVEHSVWPS